jgi:hypothetical protein
MLSSVGAFKALTAAALISLFGRGSSLKEIREASISSATGATLRFVIK